jgi:hypothetical protein
MGKWIKQFLKEQVKMTYKYIMKCLISLTIKKLVIYLTISHFGITEIQSHHSQKDYNRNKQQMLVKMWGNKDTSYILGGNVN